jgi:hypothetical protein
MKIFSVFRCKAWVFITDENNVFSNKWPSLVAKFGKTKRSKFYRIDSRLTFSINLLFGSEEITRDQKVWKLIRFLNPILLRITFVNRMKNEKGCEFCNFVSNKAYKRFDRRGKWVKKINIR